MNFSLFRMIAFAVSLAFACAFALTAQAGETIHNALAAAYENNSELNAARAGLRAADESVPLAKSGWRPRVTGNISLLSATDSQSGDTRGASTATFGIEINQTIFDGFQTRNNVQSAESQVRAQRENLRNTEQNILFDAAQAFMDVLRDRQIEVLRAQNLEFLREQLRAANARFEVGEGTRTDVAQARASLESANAQLVAARANTASSEAAYRQLTGLNPGSLTMPQPLSKILPGSLDKAYTIAEAGHPAVLARDSLVNSGLFSVKAAEGAFLPQVSLSAGVSKSYSNRGGGPLRRGGGRIARAGVRGGRDEQVARGGGRPVADHGRRGLRPPDGGRRRWRGRCRRPRRLRRGDLRPRAEILSGADDAARSGRQLGWGQDRRESRRRQEHGGGFLAAGGSFNRHKCFKFAPRS